jgi:hypothetical protein
VSRQPQAASSQLSSIPAASYGRLRTNATDPAVMPPRHRRQGTAAPVYTRVILVEANRCRQPGEVGALLRREGLYLSHLTRWRVQLRAGQLEPRKHGRKACQHAAISVPATWRVRN